MVSEGSRLGLSGSTLRPSKGSSLDNRDGTHSSGSGPSEFAQNTELPGIVRGSAQIRNPCILIAEGKRDVVNRPRCPEAAAGGGRRPPARVQDIAPYLVLVRPPERFISACYTVLLHKSLYSFSGRRSGSAKRAKKFQKERFLDSHCPGTGHLAVPMSNPPTRTPHPSVFYGRLHKIACVKNP